MSQGAQDGALDVLHPNNVTTRSRKRKQVTRLSTASARERPVAEWTVEDVQRWCKSEKTIATCAHGLEKAQVDGDILISITEQNVAKICRLRVKQGRELVAAIAALLDSSHNPNIAAKSCPAPKRTRTSRQGKPTEAFVVAEDADLAQSKSENGADPKDECAPQKRTTRAAAQASVKEATATEISITSSSRSTSTRMTISKTEMIETERLKRKERTDLEPYAPVVAVKADDSAEVAQGAAALAAIHVAPAEEATTTEVEQPPEPKPKPKEESEAQPKEESEAQPEEESEAQPTLCHVPQQPAGAQCPGAGGAAVRPVQPEELHLPGNPDSVQAMLPAHEDPDVDYDEELHSWMLDREKLMRPHQQYMKWHPSLNERMRSILLDWVMEVCREFEMQRETFHLTVNIIDRFLSCVSEVHKNRLQLVGVASLFVASKMEEIYPPKGNEFAMITDGAFTLSEIYKMERLVLRKMEWDIISVTPCWWSNLMVHRLHAAHQTHRWRGDGDGIACQSRDDKYSLVMSLLDVAILDYRSITFTSSVLAAAAVHHRLNPNDFLLQQVTGLDMATMMPCIQWMEAFLPCASTTKKFWCNASNVYRGLVDSKDYHTIQTHNPEALVTLRSTMWAPAPAPRPVTGVEHGPPCPVTGAATARVAENAIA